MTVCIIYDLEWVKSNEFLVSIFKRRTAVPMTPMLDVILSIVDLLYYHLGVCPVGKRTIDHRPYGRFGHPAPSGRWEN
jgi:hypothetical protein